MEGFLQKWVNYIYGWKKRYFILQDGVLMYCKEKGLKRKGAIHLNVAEIRQHPKIAQRFIINTGCTEIHLKAETLAEAQSWIIALKSAKDSTALEASYQRGHTAGNEAEPAEDPEATSVLVRLSGIQAAFEEKLDALPTKYKDDPLLQGIIQLAREFKYTVAQAMNLVNASKPQAPLVRHKSESPESRLGEHTKKRKLERGLTEGDLRADEFVRPLEEVEEDEDAVDFCDAKSQLSEEMFYDAHEDSFLTAAPRPHRKTLPFLRNPNQKINIWKVVKDSIGKELSKMAVPVYFNEPISFLQRFSEDLLYHDLLIKAAQDEDRFMRLALIGCFAVSGYSVTSHRHMKPFNPLLGETFELETDGLRLISEQVSHHPPVSALHCDHDLFSFWGQTEIKTSFRGAYLFVHPTGDLHVKLKTTGETFTWSKPNSTVHNIIFGKMYVDHHGDITVKNDLTGDQCLISMKKRGWFDKDPNRVEGQVSDSSGKSYLAIEGKWSEKLTIRDIDTGTEREGWAIRPFQEGFEFNYYFTEFTIQLNLPPEVFPQVIPRTDSRYRPDQRALEFGDLQTAAKEKSRVEEKQRAARKERETAGEEWMPRWFRQLGEEWCYAGGYWEQKESGQFTGISDIF